jgi:hypothetical protein
VSATPGTLAPLMDNTPAVVGTSTSFTREDHVHPVDTKAVRTEVAQGLNTTQQQQARQNIYAAPLDAMGYYGLQSNGSMEISQENSSSSVTLPPGSAKYILDGWVVTNTGSAALTSGQNSFPPSGLSSALQVLVTTPAPTIGPSDYTFIFQDIEGQRCRRLGWGAGGALPITIAFWAFAVRPGLYSGSVTNPPTFNRSYPFSFTINAGSTWEYKVISIPGDTTGTWTKDTTAGIRVTIAMACGSNFLGTAGAWTAGGRYGVTGTVNGVATTSDIFILTGFIMLPGIELPAVTHPLYVMRPYEQELALAQRYWQLFSIVFVGGYSGGVSNAYQTITYPIMRAAPSVTLFNITYSNCSLLTAYNIYPYATNLSIQTVGGVQAISYASMTLNARL